MSLDDAVGKCEIWRRDCNKVPLAPAYGLWARHVRRLTLINVDFVVDQPDPRPEILTKTEVDDVVIA